MSGQTIPEQWYADLKAQYDALVVERDRLRDELAWYADERRYKKQPVHDAERGFYPTTIPVIDDGGQRAREALAGEAGFVCPRGHRHYEGSAFCTVCEVRPAPVALAGEAG